MVQLPSTKMKKFVNALKAYRKKYLSGKYSEVDESATRLMVNEFLSEVLGFAVLDEIKTEYMIRGTYADYVVQIGGKQHFIVEVKGRGIELSEKHLRQAVNYAANEGIDWVLLTNGRQFIVHRVIFEKPISSREVFSVDLADLNQLKKSADCLQYLTKQIIAKNGLVAFWDKCCALDPNNLACLLYSPKIVSFLKRELKAKHGTRFSEEDITESIKKILEQNLEGVKPVKIPAKRRRKKTEKKSEVKSPAPQIKDNSVQAAVD